LEELYRVDEPCYAFGQGDYRGIAGYPQCTPPRYPGEDDEVVYDQDPDQEDQDQDQDLIEVQQPRNRTKRARADEPEIRRGRKAQRVGTAGGRPKAKDLDTEAKEVLETAIQYYRSRISTLNPYPDPKQESTWAKEAWKEGCRINDVDIDYDPDILTLVRLISVRYIS
jgi:hypothetical protein